MFQILFVAKKLEQPIQYLTRNLEKSIKHVSSLFWVTKNKTTNLIFSWESRRTYETCFKSFCGNRDRMTNSIFSWEFLRQKIKRPIQYLVGSL